MVQAPRLQSIVRRALFDIGVFSLLINLLMMAMPLYRKREFLRTFFR
jgi:ABC-type protease/lipase transport system fused ATPase/permease subunit